MKWLNKKNKATLKRYTLFFPKSALHQIIPYDILCVQVYYIDKQKQFAVYQIREFQIYHVFWDTRYY